MKIAALTAVGIACALTGQYIAFALDRRVVLLEKIQLMFSVTENRLKFLSIPSDELVMSLAENMQLKELSFLPCCREFIRHGESFRSAWRSALVDRRNTRFLKKEDVSLLISFGEMFGSTDTYGQLANCGLHSALMKDKLERARESRKRYTSLSMGMGVITGIGIIIIFM